MADELTGIERQLVLDYLMDGNVPVTVTPAEAAEGGRGVQDASRIFPVALRAEQLTVSGQGVILLKDAPEAVQGFDGRNVRVQFYFNKLGLYFVTAMQRAGAALALRIPEVIRRVQDSADESPYDVSAMLYYEAGERTGTVRVACGFDKSYPPFADPRWSDVEEADQKEAKAYLERAVASSRTRGTALGNGLFLIPVCRWLAHKSPAAVQANAGRVQPPTVLYLSHERIVFGSRAGGWRLTQGSEYALRLGFPLQTPVKERAVYVTCRADAVYESAGGADAAGTEAPARCAAVCSYTSLKEEDMRFLYDLYARKGA